ncbi:hypothetical protein ETQ85_11980 [Zoogloea oleivorans]|jgi:hypothetical protein|uniref:Type II secretion system protein GspC N-terminal domain-containing protein n=1 Tax=Zoogloea oleivorans TaxID=1552750 RepID=A0A6C2CS51_9RHOO|nr:type II secretion system protein N [Zoogloea oleivorans]TYC56566.1 hypothetical protein ETQ85_11980 [Zoogloea oleivorans]
MNLSERFDLTRLPWQRAMRLGPLLAWGCALAIAAWVAADLFWRFSAPRAPALPVASLADPQAAALAIASRHLMGQSAAGDPMAPAAVAAPSRYTLQAVVTGSNGRPGWAIVSIDGGAQQGVVEGQDIQPGVSLALVKGDSIEIATGGLRQTVKLAERGNTEAPGGAPPASGMSAMPPAQNFNGDASGAPDSAQRPFPAGFPAQPVPSQ